MPTTHTAKPAKYLKTEKITVASCSCGKFDVTIAGNHLKEADAHVAFHLGRHS